MIHYTLTISIIIQFGTRLLGESVPLRTAEKEPRLRTDVGILVPFYGPGRKWGFGIYPALLVAENEFGRVDPAHPTLPVC